MGDLSRWQILRRIAKRRGWLFVPFMFAIGPFVLAWAWVGKVLVIVGRWMQEVVGA